MLHDESIYANPFEFNPDRFIDPETGKIDYSRARDPEHACFGFGRRICPGRFMAFESLWLGIASLIATFDIEKPKEKVALSTGEEVERTVELTHEYKSGLVVLVHFFLPCETSDKRNLIFIFFRAAMPFRCAFRPRSEEKAELIRARLIIPEKNKSKIYSLYSIPNLRLTFTGSTSPLYPPLISDFCIVRT